MPSSASSDAGLTTVVELLDGFRASKALFAAVSMKLFDRLQQRPSTLSELAPDLGCSEHALERLLGFLLSKQLLQRDASGRFGNSETAERFLRIESPETLTGYILYSDRILYRLWSRLGDALNEGSNRWEQEFGAKEGIFEHFFSSDDERDTFLRGMHGLGLLSSPAAIAAFDLSRYRTMVDLGGGTAHLVIEACRRYPDLGGIVFDLPAAAAVSRRYIAEADLESRIEVVAGDFFSDPLPAADLYALSRILHDWSDEKVRLLLSRVHERLPAGGGLLICEQLLNDDKSGPSTTLLQSLSMLICTEGRERSPAEYEALVREAGFEDFSYRRSGKPVDVMLARK